LDSLNPKIHPRVPDADHVATIAFAEVDFSRRARFAPGAAYTSRAGLIAAFASLAARARFGSRATFWRCAAYRGNRSSSSGERRCRASPYHAGYGGTHAATATSSADEDVFVTSTRASNRENAAYKAQNQKQFLHIFHGIT
jgi:hypothetical protein